LFIEVGRGRNDPLPDAEASVVTAMSERSFIAAGCGRKDPLSDVQVLISAARERTFVQHIRLC